MEALFFKAQNMQKPWGTAQSKTSEHTVNIYTV